MEEKQLISWILLATALASDKEPSNFNGISLVADGINHSIPTSKELQSSLKWLINNTLVVKTGKKYQLSSDGIRIFEAAKSRTNNIILNIWDELSKEIDRMQRSQLSK